MACELVIFDWSGTLSPLEASQGGNILYEDVRPVLMGLKARSLLTAVATMLPQRLLIEAIHDNDLEGVFVTMATGSECLAKPNPEMIQKILDFCGLMPSAAVMVGDSYIDIEMAQAAQVRAIALDRSGASNSIRQGDVVTIQSLTDLFTVLDQ